MHLITLTTSPAESFDLPLSEGYQIYSSLLALLQDADPVVSKHVHDTVFPTLSIGGLSGPSGKSQRKGYRKILAGKHYLLRIGISDTQDVQVFTNLITPFILNRKEITLAGGTLSIREIQTSSTTFEELLKQAVSYKKPVIDMHFVSPTCIQYRNSKITEMFPHRIAVFYSILAKWNLICPDRLRLGLVRDDFGRYLIEQPEPCSYKTHSVMVNTIFDRLKEHPRPIFRQGFTSSCRYRFATNTPASVKNATVTLALFAQYSGVGSGVSRGCGQVITSITDGDVQ